MVSAPDRPRHVADGMWWGPGKWMTGEQWQAFVRDAVAVETRNRRRSVEKNCEGVANAAGALIGEEMRKARLSIEEATRDLRGELDELRRQIRTRDQAIARLETILNATRTLDDDLSRGGRGKGKGLTQ